jgi:hypothetical protein
MLGASGSRHAFFSGLAALAPASPQANQRSAAPREPWTSFGVMGLNW